MVRKTVLSKMLNFLLNFYSLAFQWNTFKKNWIALLQNNLQSSGYFLLLVFDFNPKPSTCKMNISSVTMIWIGPSKWQSPLFVCEISRGTNTYVTKSRLMFFAVVYSLQVNNFWANFPGVQSSLFQVTKEQMEKIHQIEQRKYNWKVNNHYSAVIIARNSS